MKAKSHSLKLLSLLAVALILFALAFVFALDTRAAEPDGLSVGAKDHYTMIAGLTPNGSITFESEIWLPEAYHASKNVRAGNIIANYNGGGYKGAYLFEIYSGGKMRVFALNGTVNVFLDYDITKHMGTDADPKFVKVAVTVDTTATTNNVKLYVNEDPVAKATGSTGASTTVNMYNTTHTDGTSRNLEIGNDERGNRDPMNFKGKIKNIAMYSGIRDYKAAKYFDTSDANMLFGYNLTQVHDGFLKDLSKNANHANNLNWKPTEGVSFVNTTTNMPTVSKAYTEAPYTYEAVVYTPLGTARGGPILANYPNDNGDSFMFEIKSNGKPAIYIYDNGASRLGGYEFNYDTRRNAFVHVAITHETVYNASTSATDTVFKCYVDGEYVDSYTVANYVFKMDMESFAKTRSYTIGYCGRAGLYNLGYIKNITLRNRPLNAEEIKASYDNGVNAKADDVIAYYDLTQVQDGFIKDESGNGYHANYPQWKPSEGRTFSESENILYASKDLDTAPYTYEAVLWAPLGVSRTGAIIANYPNTNGESIMFEIKDNGQPAIYIWDGTAKIECANHAFKYDVRRSTFVHVAITHETVGNDTLFKCYVDGELVDTYTHSGYVFKMDMDAIALTGALSLGHCGRSSIYYKGNIKSVALHDKPLSAEEIKASYENGISSNSESLILHYDMSGAEATSDTVTDITGNGYEMKGLFYEKDFVTPEYDYAFAVIGDTQFMVHHDATTGTPLKDENGNVISYYNPSVNDYRTKYIYDYIVNNINAKKIKYVFGLGDIIDNAKFADGTSSTAAEWNYAYGLITDTIGKAGVPYSLIGGNHDFMRPWDTGFNATFGSELTFINNITGYYSGTDVYNYYMNFEVEGTPYMLLALEYGANDDILAWANDVVSRNSHRTVIVTTHGYMYSDGTTIDGGDQYAPKPNGTTNEHHLKYNNGDEMWEEFVRKHANISIVLSGHVDHNDIVMREDIGDHGNTVHQFLIDPQKMDRAYAYETGMVAMFYFSNGGKDVTVEYVSTYKTAKNANKEVLFNARNQKSFTIKNAAPENSKGEIDVWLIGGQSNAAGYGNGLNDSDTRYYGGFDNVLYYGYSERWANDFTPVKIGLGNSATNSGAEIGIASLVGNTGKMNAIIKYAEGASCICPSTTDVDAKRNGTWTSPTYIKNNSIVTDGTKVGILYESFINTVESAIAELRLMGYTPVVRGMWWMQGEAETYIDANIGASKYEDLLTALIGDVRRDVGAITGENLSAMPFVFGKIYRNPSESQMPHYETVRAAQVAVSGSVANTAIVDPTEFDGFAQHDGWHYNAATQRYIGKTFVERALAISGLSIVMTDNPNVVINGGGIYKAGDSVTVGFTPREGYTVTSISKTVGTGTQAITLDGSGKYTFTVEGNTVFAVSAKGEGVSTDYGTIPPSNSSSDDYPVVMFSGGAPVGYYSDIGAAVNAALEINSSGTFNILVRRNITNNTQSSVSYFLGEMTIDLGGNTVDNRANYLFDIWNNDGAGRTSGRFTMKNGTVAKNGGITLICTNGANELTKDAKFNFTFDNVTFVSSVVSDSVILHTWSNSSSSSASITADVTFNNCTFDFLNSAEGVKMMVATATGTDKTVYNIKVNGGKILASNAADLSDLVTLDSKDSFAFGNAGGSYTTLEMPAGAAAPDVAYNGGALVFNYTEAKDGFDVYTLGSPAEALKPEATVYGDIPVDYLSKDAYPIILFNADTKAFIAAYSEWGAAVVGAVQNNGGNGNYVLLIRKDVNQTTGGVINDFRGTLLIDLGNNTVYRGESGYMLDAYVYENSWATSTDIRGSVTVKNGKIVKGGSFAVACLNYGTPLSQNAVYSFNFENVTFSATAGKNVIFETWEDGYNENLGARIYANATFTDCVFDYQSSVGGIVMFPLTLGGKNGAVFNVTVKGGKIISDRTVAYSDFAVTDSYDTVTFEKNAQGELVKLLLTEGAEAPSVSEGFAEISGTKYVFVKAGLDGVYTEYSLIPKLAADFTPKTSVTLYTDFIYNIYIPKVAALSSVKLNSAEVVTHDLTTVTLSDGRDYYKLKVVLGSHESLEDVRLDVVLTEGEASFGGSFTFSIFKYASKLIEGEYKNYEKTLARDMLSYAKSAYTYWGKTSDKLASVDALLGADYNNTADMSKADTATAPENTGFSGVTLHLGEAPSYRFYYTTATAPAYTFKIGNRTVSATAGSDKNGNYLEIKAYAYEMLLDVTFGNHTYSAYSYYAYAKANNMTREMALVERLVNYCESAEAYRASVAK